MAEGLSVAFNSGTLVESPTWARVDDPDDGYGVQGWRIDRGRVGELERMGTGVASADAADSVGWSDPTNTGGPFYGKIDPMRQASISLFDPVAEAWGMIFRGFVNEWIYEMDPSEKVIYTRLEMADGMDLLSAILLNPGDFGGVTIPTGGEGDIYFDDDAALTAVQTRMQDLLTAAGWPSGLAAINTGNVGLQGYVADRNDAVLSALLDSADAEFPGVANVYFDRTGVLRFHGRYPRFNPADVSYDIRTWLVGDNTAAMADTDVVPISAMKFRRSKLDIINQALALPQNVDESDVPGATVKDMTSQGIYGIRAESWPDLLTRNGEGPTTALEETAKFAEYYVGNYADPRTRVHSVSFRPVATSHPNAAALWDMMINVEINDIVTITTSHPGGGGFNAEDFFVDGIHYDASPLNSQMHDVTLTLDVSPRAYFTTSDPFPH